MVQNYNCILFKVQKYLEQQHLASFDPAKITINVSSKSANTLTKDVYESLLRSFSSDSGSAQKIPNNNITEDRSVKAGVVLPEAATTVGMVSPTMMR